MSSALAVEEKKIAARKRASLWYLNNKERAKMTRANYYQRNREGTLRRSRLYYQEHKDECSAKSAEWYINHKPEVLERMRLYYIENGESIRARVLKYYEEHKDEINIKQRQYYFEHHDEMMDKAHIWRMTHKEEKLKYQLEYARTHRDEVNAYRRKRRKALRGFRMTPEMFDSLLSKYGNKCYYCGIEYPDTSDHYIPLMRDGEPGLDNIVPACMSCNCKKNDMLPSEFSEYMEREKILLAALNGMER